MLGLIIAEISKSIQTLATIAKVCHGIEIASNVIKSFQQLSEIDRALANDLARIEATKKARLAASERALTTRAIGLLRKSEQEHVERIERLRKIGADRTQIAKVEGIIAEIRSEIVRLERL
jgi:hypothetical protein